MEIHEFREMVKEIRILEKALGNISYELSEKSINSRKFSRSLFFTQDIKKDEEITEKNMRSIRPCYGLHPRHYDDIIGKVAAEDIIKGTPVKWELIK
jgi:pseudaminic acid synthase